MKIKILDKTHLHFCSLVAYTTNLQKTRFDLFFAYLPFEHIPHKLTFLTSWWFSQAQSQIFKLLTFVFNHFQSNARNYLELYSLECLQMRSQSLSLVFERLPMLRIILYQMLVMIRIILLIDCLHMFRIASNITMFWRFISLIYSFNYKLFSVKFLIILNCILINNIQNRFQLKAGCEMKVP